MIQFANDYFGALLQDLVLLLPFVVLIKLIIYMVREAI